jgi:N-acetylneuraminic acid mutarotase
VRSYLSVVSDGLKIYTFGGVEEKYNLSLQKIVKATSNVIESFTPDSFLSFQTSKMYSPRCYHSSISYNGMIFSFGGMATDRKDVSTIEVFDPVSGQSRIIDSLPYIRYGASLSIVNNKILMAGGVVVRGLDTAVTGAIDIYDIAKAGSGNDALSHYGELLKPRTNHSAVVHDGRLFVIGGVDTSTFNTLSDVEMFDLHTGTQTVVPAMNQNRAHFSAVIVEDRVFAFGGVSNLETYLSSVEVMDLGNNDGWKFVNQMNHPKYGMATVVHNGKVYMLGGNVIGANGKIELDSTVNVYYP